MASAQEDHGILQELAERLGLDDEESENFISSSMRRLGHKARVAWEDAEGDAGKGGGDFFGRRREQRQVGGRQRPQQRGSGDGWQYDRSG